MRPRERETRGLRLKTQREKVRWDEVTRKWRLNERERERARAGWVAERKREGAY